VLDADPVADCDAVPLPDAVIVPVGVPDNVMEGDAVALELGETLVVLVPLAVGDSEVVAVMGAVREADAVWVTDGVTLPVPLAVSVPENDPANTNIGAMT